MTFPSDEQFAADVRRELLENILPFWRNRSVDAAHGGFIAEMSNDLHAQARSRQGIDPQRAALVDIFGRVSIHAAMPKTSRLAHRAYEYLTSQFLDP